MNNGRIELWSQQLLEIQTEDGEIYASTILRVGDQELMLQHPSSNDNLLIPVPTRQVSIYFYEDRNLYEYQTELIFQNNRFLIPKPKPEQLTRIQRRNYFRVPAVLDLWLATSGGKKQRFVTEDISGGGIAFHSGDDEPFIAGDQVEGELALKNKNGTVPIYFRGEIIHANWTDYKRTRYAMTFTDIRESDRKEIIRFCLNRQVEIYKRTGRKV